MDLVKSTEHATESHSATKACPDHHWPPFRQAIKVQNAKVVKLDTASGQELQQKVALALVTQAHA